jgi:hypothetical protein
MSDEHRDEHGASGPEDSRFDEILREAAQDYNRPPGTPRELMWNRIEARREAGRERRDAGVIPMRRPTHRHWLRWGVGIAAALALGFGLGRMSGDRGRGVPRSIAVAGRPAAQRPDSGAARAPSAALPAVSAENAARSSAHSTVSSAATTSAERGCPVRGEGLGVVIRLSTVGAPPLTT